MSHIEIRTAQFPQAIPNHLAVGDNIRLTITARISRIEEEQIDVSSLPGHTEILPGQRATQLTILTVTHTP